MPPEEPSIVDRLADPESLLGMLQRGRGKGYLQALETPPEQVWPLLLECVSDDSSKDFYWGGRHTYYASLILAIGMDLEPLCSCLRQNDLTDQRCGCDVGLAELGIPLGTLACLAKRGDLQALRILKNYVSVGYRWSQVVLELGELGTPEALKGVDESLYKRITADEGSYAEFANKAKEDWRTYCQRDLEARASGGLLLLPIYEPWKMFCQKNPRFAALFDKVGITYGQAPPPPERITEAEVRELSVEQIFALVGESNWPRLATFLRKKVSPEDEDCLLRELSSDDRYHVMLALRGLGQIGTPKAFEAVKSHIETAEDNDRGIRAMASEAFGHMPACLALDTARKWFVSKENRFCVPASWVLRQHATLDDVPMLIQALRIPETVREEENHLWSILEALTLFSGIGPIQELETVFCETSDCDNRYQAAVAMDITGPVHFQSEYTFECLWDCYHETRALGCETVNLTELGALERLKELAADEDESDRVREAAQARIEGF